MANSTASSSRVRHKPIVYVVGFTAALAGLLFGLDIGVISGAEQFIQKDFGITDRMIEFIVSSLLWGAVAGTLLSGYLSSRLGRKRTMMLAGAIFVIGSLLCAVTPSAELMIAFRFFLGLGVGMASFTAPLYLSEMSPPNIRGAMISMYQLMITIGIVLAFMSNTYLGSYATFDNVSGIHWETHADPNHAKQLIVEMEPKTGGHWRMMLGVVAIPALIMFLGVSRLPESPRWLLLRQYSERALKVLKRIRPTEADARKEVAQIEESLKVPCLGFQLFKENANFRRAILLGVGLQVVQQFTGINVIMYYAPRILKAAGFTSTEQQLWGTVLIGLINVLATFIAIAFVDKLGRKKLLYAGFVVMGLSMGTVGWLFKIGVGQNESLAYLAVGALLLFIIGFAMSAGPIMWVICSEIYPLQGRDFGITVSTATNWISNAIVGMTFLSMLTSFGDGNTFLLYGALNILFIVFTIFFVPETKDVSLEEIETNLLSGKKLRSIGK